MPWNDNFVDNLKAVCERRKISQRALAEMSDVHYVTINRIFNGTLQPSVDTCEKIAGALELGPEKIFAERQ